MFTRTPSPLRQMEHPLHQRSVPPEQQTSRPTRVSQDDELSETRSWSAHSDRPAQVVTPTHISVGLQMPIPSQAPQLPHQRSGPPNTSEDQLLRILQGQQLTQPTRTTAVEDRVGQTRLMRHHLPLSTASSQSARPAPAVVRNTTPAWPTSMGRVAEAIGIMNNNRAQRHAGSPNG